MVPNLQHLFLDHSAKFFFADNFDPKLVRFLELAPRFLAGQDVGCFLAHAAAHFSATAGNHFCDFVARLTQRAGNDPGRLSKW